jgi:hypothetical protein
LIITLSKINIALLNRGVRELAFEPTDKGSVKPLTLKPFKAKRG